MKIATLKTYKSIIKNRLFINMALTFFAKGLTLLSNLASIPLLISLIGSESYGSWVTLTSILTWVILLDFGLGHGIKNLVAKKSDLNKIDSSILFVIIGSIQFFVVLCIALIFALLISVSFVKILHWNVFSTLIIYLPFFIAFPFSIGNAVLQGLRKTGLQSIIGIIKPFFWLTSLIMLKLLEVQNNVQIIAILFSISNVLLFIVSFQIANRFVGLKFKDILSFSKIKHSLSIIKIGVQFFILQISSIMIFNIGNYLNYTFLGGLATANYDVANKLFLFYISFFNLIISVYWPEIANAIVNNKMRLLKLRKQLNIYCLLFILGGSVLLLISPFCFRVLTNSEITVEINQLIPFYLLVVIQAISYIGAVFLNAAEKIKGQIVLSIVSSCLIIPVSILFFKLGFNITSVPLASSIVLLPTSVLLNIWTNKTIAASIKV